jgi:Xaa-Pro aminopeptidase
LFARARSIKTPEAIKLFRRAAYKTEKAIALGFASTKYGDTELKLAREMQSTIVKLGADMYSFAALASGPDSYMVHLSARDQKMVKGDVVHIDFGGVFSGYRTDISRGGVCVKANEKQTQRWKSLWRAERSAIEKSVQVGKKASDIYNTLKKEFKANNIRFESYHGPGHVGHSIGLETHEPPMLQPYNDSILEENMILCIEPTVLEKGWARYHVEDMVLVTKKGPEILSNYTEGDELFVIEE